MPVEISYCKNFLTSVISLTNKPNNGVDLLCNLLLFNSKFVCKYKESKHLSVYDYHKCHVQ